MRGRQVDLSGLNAEERLSLLEELWESLAETPEAVPLTRAQRDELNRRIDEMEADGGQGIPWQEVLDRIRSQTLLA